MNKGCCCGSYVGAFNFIQKNEITLEVAYPYTTKDGKCVVNRKNSSLVFIDSYKKVLENEDSLHKTVANQPVFIAIDSHGSNFEDYYGRVFIQNSDTNLDHEMTVVGYVQTLDDFKYWILRNSWGPM
ncbi:Vignain [Platanthera zijinensis]|uniref:Vignain n=1 Tax=Platanthera zijinensis TaxID=2320716 RepID=A0AAP0B486_9ASPA